MLAYWVLTWFLFGVLLSPPDLLLSAVGEGVCNVIGVGAVGVAVGAVAVPSAARAGGPAVTVVFLNVVGHVVLGQELPDGDEPGDGQRDEGGEDGFLGDQGNDEVSENSES